MMLRHTLLVAAFCVLLGVWCVLVPGADRLLATAPEVAQTEAAQAAGPERQPLPAALCAGEPVRVPQEPQGQPVRTARDEALAPAAWQGAPPTGRAQLRDANGNVLQAGRFGLLAYRAIALGGEGG